MLTLHTAHALLQEFLRCDYFIDTGAPGLLLRLRAATAACLQDVDFGGSATQQVWMQGLGLRLSSVSLLLFLAAGHVPPTLTPPPFPLSYTLIHTPSLSVQVMWLPPHTRAAGRGGPICSHARVI